MEASDNLMDFLARAKYIDLFIDEQSKAKMALVKQNQEEKKQQERRDLENRLFFADMDCKITQKKLSDFDLYLSSFLRLEVKNIK